MPLRRRTVISRLPKRRRKVIVELLQSSEKWNRCESCGKKTENLEEHHRWVRGKGGKVRIVFYLCKECHDRHHPFRGELLEAQVLLGQFKESQCPEIGRKILEKLQRVNRQRRLAIFLFDSTIVYRLAEEEESNIEEGTHIWLYNTVAEKTIKVPLIHIERITLSGYYP